MKIFEDINAESVLNDGRVVNIFTRYDQYSIEGTHFVILKDDEYLLICRISLPSSPVLNPTRDKWSGGIILEVPIAGFLWFVNALENKFFKTEAEGGLVRGIYTAETEIDGEKLSISRMFGIPGYSFTNHSRTAHWASRHNLIKLQELELPDELLFESGYFSELKNLAATL